MIVTCFRRLGLPVLLMLISLKVQALDYIAESDFFGEAPVVLTVSRMHKPLEQSPASVSIIDREMIRNSGAREVAELLRMAPGMVTGIFLGHTPAVAYHGLGEQFHRQLQVLIDGRSVFVPSFQGVPWSSLPLLIEDIERIEITRGPNAVTYGSNAFLATINIITRHAAEDLGGRISATKSLDSDSGVEDLYFRYGNQIEDLDWRISVGRETDDGYDVRQAGPNTFREVNDSKTVDRINLRTDFLTAHNQFWTVQAGLTQNTFGLGEIADDEPLDIARDGEITNEYQNIIWELIDPKVQTTIKLTHTRHNYEDSFVADLPGLPGATANLFRDRVSDRTDLEVYQNRMLNDTFSINYGLSLRRDEVRSQYLFADNLEHEVDTNSLFTSLEWMPWMETTIDLGLLIEDVDISETANTYRETENSYRISLIQQLGNNHALRLVNSTAKRHPMLFEVIGNAQFDLIPPPGLPPPLDQPLTGEFEFLNDNDVAAESIRSFEIGLFSEFLDRQLTTDIKLFSYKISDQLIVRTVPLDPPVVILGNVLDDEVDTISNGGSTTVRGVEASFNYSPTHEHYRLYGGLSQKQASSTQQDPVQSQEIEHSFPERTGFIGGHIDLSPAHQVSATQYYVDSMSWIDRTVILDSYSRLDLRYQFTIDAEHELKLELIGYSVGGNYRDYRNSHKHQQTYLLRISGRF